MIVALGADKGSPGATTLTVLLGMHWPGERVVIEADPRGADLPYRMTGQDGQPLAASPSITTVAVDSRPGAPPRSLTAYTQATALGVPVIPGETSPRRFARVVDHLPAITDSAATWLGTALIDIGQLSTANPAMQVARSATVTVLVSRADTEHLARLRERAEHLAGELGGPFRTRTPLAVVARAEHDDERHAAPRIEKLLASIGSPVRVIGTLPDDPSAATALWSGQLSRRLFRSPLVRAGQAITERLRALWPELTEPATATGPAPASAAAPTGVVR